MAITLERTSKAGLSRNGRHEPVWNIARFYPLQGDWTEEDYFSLERTSGNWMIELNDGCLEFPPMPDPFHQDIVDFLFTAFKAFLKDRQFGRAYFAPLPIRLWAGQIREPDIAILGYHRLKNKRKAPDGADLVVEIVSPGEEARERDLETKRREYAKAGIREYWIVDPEERTITVLTLSGKSYRVHGVFEAGDEAASKLLKGFKVAVSGAFAAGEGK
ncbi:MAG: Uma2 family endonuclease [Planctomycetes bacterium]|nr:Uma2 family endonuclease [Planctomycetota bacterium]